MKKLHRLLIGLRLIVAIILHPFFKERFKNSWLIFERENTPGDNGWLFYHWMKEHHSEQKTFFLLGKKSIKEMGLENDPQIIPLRSLKHFYIYFSSSIFIRTFFNFQFPFDIGRKYYEKVTKKENKIIYLRHGILASDIKLHTYDRQKVNIFICGAKPEYEYFLKEGGYPNDVLRYTGLARFDELLEKQTDKKFILILPTWRRYQQYLYKPTNDITINNEFKKSSFYIHFHSLLSNKSFIDYIINRGYSIKFGLHAMFDGYITLFDNIDSRVQIINKKEESIHELLMSASLLITDYSSLFFDVAYMQKPLIMYQFDYDEFREKHFKEGYFSYERDVMGPVVKDENELVDAVRGFYNEATNRFENKDIYIERCLQFFPMRDGKNCERIYEAIKSIDN